MLIAEEAAPKFRQPRAVIVGWDTLDAPTKRREMFPDKYIEATLLTD
jgi:hypothetical protein